MFQFKIERKGEYFFFKTHYTISEKFYIKKIIKMFIQILTNRSEDGYNQ